MGWLAQYQALARYNRWMNRKLYASCAGLDDAERKRDRGAYFKSIHGTLNHLLVADCTWLGRFWNDTTRAPLDAQGQLVAITALSQELFTDFAALRRERERVDGLLLDYVAALSEVQLAGDFVYTSMAGQLQSGVLWWALGHVFNHQTHHRGQVTTLLSQAGLDVGVTDLVAMLREEQRG